MKRIIQLLMLSLCMFSCSENSDFVEVQNPESIERSSRNAGDGIYDLLGYGYDITGEYLEQSATRRKILDVDLFVKNNIDRFDNPFIGTITQRIFAGEDAQSFLKQMISSSNFSGSVGSMADKKDKEGFFSATISTGFKSDSKYSYSSKYSFARVEVLKKQRQCLLNTDIETLSKYLSTSFKEDLNKYSADRIVEIYGTHVLTNITIGGTYTAYYKSAIVEESNRTEKTNIVSAGAKCNLSKIGLDANGSWSTTEIVETNKKNSNWECNIECRGGSTSGTTITLSPNQGPTYSINLGTWSQSVDDTHSKLVDLDWNATYPIYDLIADPVKKAELKDAVNRYIDSKKIEVLVLEPLYVMYWPKGVNTHMVTSWGDVLKYVSEGHNYAGICGYINAAPASGTQAVYGMYWPEGKNTHYLTSWNEVTQRQNEGHNYNGIFGYINKTQVNGTVPLYCLYYPKGKDSHWETSWAAVENWVRNRGDEYGGILGYIYK